MGGKVFGIYSPKGGVGKTTSAVNLAYLSASRNLKTLLWDMDTQGGSTFYVQVKPKIRGGMKKLLHGTHNPLHSVRESSYKNLHVLPADHSARHMDILLNDIKQAKKTVRGMLTEFRKLYDVVILDLPPGQSKLAELLFARSDWQLVPLVPTPLAMRSIEMVEQLDSKAMGESRCRYFFTISDLRKKLHREILEHYSRDPRVLPTSIPSSSLVEQMGIRRKPLNVYSHRSRVAENYSRLWQDIEELSGLGT